jgi:hypothetical protein
MAVQVGGGKKDGCGCQRFVAGSDGVTGIVSGAQSKRDISVPQAPHIHLRPPLTACTRAVWT